MTVNNYFQSGNGIGITGEQNLVEDTIIEMIQMAGKEFYYIPREQNDLDQLFLEDPLSSFSTAIPIEMYLQNATEFGGQGDLLGSFGLEVNDTVELVVSKKRFNQEFTTPPKEGDLIYFPLSKALFEINYVEYEHQFYQLSKIYTYLLKCSLYTYSYEDFETGIDDVDVQLDDETFEDRTDTNDEIDTEADTYRNFDPKNPFGDTGI